VAFNILVVDDSAVMRAMIIRVLRLSSVPVGEIHQASNGEDGLRLLNENWVDLALVDLNMPVMNGEELIERIRQNPETATLPIVVVSTESCETRIESLRRKNVDFIHKPFNPEQLGNTILRLTGLSHEQHDGSTAPQFSGPDF
jgi:two-component system, chemotaxis family, chemotaxis protein CheY